MADTFFNPDLVVVGRDLRSMSQAQLAKASGISQGHLSKIENGLIPADAERAQKLAQALSLPVTFFKQRDQVYGAPVSVHPMFRKMSAVPKRTIDRITAELNVRIMTIRKMLRSVELESSMPMPRYDIDSEDYTASEIAGLVRRAWMLPRGPLRNLTEAVEAAGAIVVHCDFTNTKIDGVTLRVPDAPTCIFLNRYQPADRMRFSLAHELGHVVMHRQPTASMEDEATEFASALLMPKGEFAASCARKIDLPELARLKELWKVSMQAALVRADRIGLLTANQTSYLWRQISALGYRKREPASTEFPREQPTILPQFLRLHMDELGYSLREMAEAMCLTEEDFRRLYGEDLGGRPRLRVVK